MKLENIIAVVTGGASGLGEATVRKIIAAGGRAVIADRNEERAADLAQELGDRCLFHPTDVTSETEINQLLDLTVDQFGSINAVVNCAGIAIAEKVVGKGGAHDLGRFSKVIEVNLIGTFNMIRLAGERMQSNMANEDDERGVIINTASVAAFEGQIGQAAYSASKGGVASMTLPVAREFARHGIRVMSIAPGLFETPMFATLPESAREALGKMTPFPSRLGKPAEYAELVSSIIGNPMLNGEVIRLDGAIRMQPK
ncbi:3-hydroxy-2-methylbutyryl-CoA dehydrogenase [Thalassobacillus devorans]|uniref:3-hydroxy-2-methylbutyryl-CoA dehydrogenase n=1 Tax=Thalassobacillus devorans TaxID=279813 RepID=A0ABQ1PMA2_9BACI|nr:3-hydroxyacyl-CoA dehydrogenase [Thalassobacillus devorans]NIK30239.1 NAD(P)-dependent dehydrogenase (short-subunit alcohol dehydrogenase family) [Thalassobacillus devorans]GGC99506.1 3-hydroxy-2-methylbutyryl-CoA dehydrogenase [Thalassobacillus devorans]